MVEGDLVSLFSLVPLLLSPKNPNPVKLMPYESGMDPIGDARQRFDVRYYLVAILFIIFDLEAAFLFPWAVTLGFALLGLAAEAAAGRGGWTHVAVDRHGAVGRVARQLERRPPGSEEFDDAVGPRQPARKR